MSIVAYNVCKDFGSTRVLHNISFTIQSGEFVSISGKSGSGKSTLLYLLSTLDFPTSGEITVDGKNPQLMEQNELHHLRNSKIGFVFQFHYLLSELSAIENVLLPARRDGRHKQLHEKAHRLLCDFDLASKIDRLPSELSGGEQQRVAIARALILEPAHIFADEPTGNLDSVNGNIVMDLLKQVNKEKGATLTLVTHEPEFAAMASRQINLVDGGMVTDT